MDLSSNTYVELCCQILKNLKIRLFHDYMIFHFCKKAGRRWDTAQIYAKHTDGLLVMIKIEDEIITRNVFFQTFVLDVWWPRLFWMAHFVHAARSHIFNLATNTMNRQLQTSPTWNMKKDVWRLSQFFFFINQRFTRPGMGSGTWAVYGLVWFYLKILFVKIMTVYRLNSSLAKTFGPNSDSTS